MGKHDKSLAPDRSETEDRTLGSFFARPLAWVAIAVTCIFVATGAGFWIVSSQYGERAGEDRLTSASADASADDLVNYLTSEAPKSSSAPPGMDDAVKRLAARLENEPDDVEGWQLLARSYLSLERPQLAAEAFGRVRDLLPQDGEAHNAYGEALVLASGGLVTAEAVAAFERALLFLPDNPHSRYFLALAAYQSGREQEALESWRTLVASAPEDAPWVAFVKAQIAEATGKPLQVEEPPLPEVVARAEPKPQPEKLPGLTAEDLSAANDLSEQDRNAMVESMVAGLAAKLEDDPSNPDRWLMLARSYGVLERTKDQIYALKRASEAGPGRVDILELYARALRQQADGEQTPEALDIMKRILTLDGNHLQALWFVGTAEAKAGNTARASELIEQALAQIPEGTARHKELKRRADLLLKAPQ